MCMHRLHAIDEGVSLSYVVECINHSAVLTLFTHAVQCLSQCKSPAAEYNMLKDLTTWCASIKPRLEITILSGDYKL